MLIRAKRGQRIVESYPSDTGALFSSSIFVSDGMPKY